MTRSFRLLLAMAAIVSVAVPSFAQTPAQPPPANTQPAPDDDPDMDANASQPDFYVATQNTNLRLPKGKFNFRLTHRFLHTLGDGDFGDLFGRAFGLDDGAQIGLDLKYGLARGLNVGIYRTSDKTIQLGGQYNFIKDGNGPVGLSLLANVDGTDNFSDEFSPGVGLVISRELGDRGALYFQPSWVGNTNITAIESDEDYTVLAGLGARLRLGRNSYVFVEGSPRVAGFDPAVTFISFGFDYRYGGHVFQLNFSNGFGTTLAQVARGGSARDNWYFGFNLARKFF